MRELNQELAFVAILGIPDYRRISKFRGINRRVGNKSTPRQFFQSDAGSSGFKAPLTLRSHGQ